MHNVFIARQPIYDRNLEVYGYELLYRHADADRAEVFDGDQATSQVILNAFTVIGLDKLVGQRRAFINLTRGFLLSPDRVPLPPDRVVLEVLEGVEPDEQLLTKLKELKAAGYRISLDDFIWHDRLRPLVALADLVKVEVMALSPAQIAEHVRQLRPYGVKLLAEKVETQAQYDHCRDVGFDYFQGFFLSRPHVVRGSSIPTSRLPTLNLLAALNRPDVDLAELERLIGQDVSLSYKLLRYLNSAFFTLPRRIDTIHQAVVYLGVQELRSWASLLALAAVPDKPQELLVTLMVRAKMCEELARHLGLEPASHYFMVGLFSGLDAIMDAPLEEIVAALPLSEATVAALLEHRGQAGEVLACVLAYEMGDWEHTLTPQISRDAVIDAYLQAVAWSEELKVAS